MPRYKVTAPDGSQHFVNAPEGATMDQALDYFKQNYKPQQAQPDMASLQSAFLKAHDAGDTENAAFLAKQIRARQPQQAQPERDVFQKLAGNNEDGGAQGREDFMRAAWHHAGNLPLGVAQLAANVLPGQSGEKMNQYMRDREAGYQGKIGDTAAGDLGAVMGEIPGMVGAGGLARPMVTGAAKLVGKAPVLGRPLAGLTGATGEGAAIGAAMPKTGADEDFWGQTAEQALVGGALQPVASGLAKAAGAAVNGPLRNSQGSAQARALRQAMPSVEQPFWKQSDGVVRNMAEGLKVMPRTKAAMTDKETNAFTQYNQEMARRAMPPVPVMDEAGNVLRWEAPTASGKVGSEFVDENIGNFDKAYGAMYKGRTVPLDDQFHSGAGDMLADVNNYRPEIAQVVNGRVNMINKPLGIGQPLQTTTQPARQLDTLTNTWSTPSVNQQGGHVGVTAQSMSEAISGAHGEAAALARDGQHQAADYLRQYARHLEDTRLRGLPPEVQSQVAPINEAFQNFAQYRRGMLSPTAQTQGMLTPKQHLTAIVGNGKKYGGMNRTASGNLPNQADATLASQVLGSKIPDVGPGTGEKMFSYLSLLKPPLIALDYLTSKGVSSGALQRAMTGQTGMQQALRNASVNPYLKRAAGNVYRAAPGVVAGASIDETNK